MLEQIIGPFLGALFGAGAAWGAIRADVRALRRDVDRHETILLTKVLKGTADG